MSAAKRRAIKAQSRFHLRIGQVGRRDDMIRDDYTLPLLPLLLILEADGALHEDVRVAAKTTTKPK